MAKTKLWDVWAVAVSLQYVDPQSMNTIIQRTLSKALKANLCVCGMNKTVEFIQGYIVAQLIFMRPSK